MSTNRRKFKCLDCKVDTGKIGEHYFVHNEVWIPVVGSKNHMLCIGCLENRLGRKLNKNDFPRVHINNPKLYAMSTRLKNRLDK